MGADDCVDGNWNFTVYCSICSRCPHNLEEKARIRCSLPSAIYEDIFHQTANCREILIFISHCLQQVRGKAFSKSFASRFWLQWDLAA